MRDDDAHAKLRNKMAAGVSPIALKLYTTKVLSILIVLRQRKRVSRANHR